MKVCIAEKPSVAQTIATVLGARQRMNGYYEGNGYQVTWTYGHLCSLKAPHEYSPDWKHWRMEYLPMIPPRFGITLIDDEGIRRQFGIIASLYAAADSIINCGDAGQEGELIQRWVMQKAGVHCPVYRLWISSLTDEAIREGFAHLEPQSRYDRLYAAGLSRAIGDWLLGMNATRLYTLRYGQARQVLSIGRVQTPTLALIVKRHWEIANFVPTQYWELKTVYRDVTFAAVKGRFETEAEGQEALAKIVGVPFVVTDVAQKAGREAPPRLFDLTSLQVECNKKFSLSADETLRIIQSLYEKKVTTYPRVDTTFLPDDVYPKCAGILAHMAGYEALTRPLLAAGKALPKSKKVFDNTKVTDHHAIIPTGSSAQTITADERRVYDLVARRFIAAFYPDCRFNTTTVLGASGGVSFKATGKVITDPGWRVVMPPSASSKGEADDGPNGADTLSSSAPSGDGGGLLPDFRTGESGPHVPSLAEKWTRPPELYTEATLLRAMETAGKLCEDETLRDAMKENGLGRPSTRAAIIETLYKRNYIRKERKSIVATQTGLEIIATVRDELLKSAELTGQWESKLRKIERGEYEAADFLNGLKEMVRQIVAGVKGDRDGRRVTTTAPDPTPAAPDKAKPRRATSATAGDEKKARKPRASRPKPAAARYTLATLPTTCPLCGKGTIIKGRTAYGCSEFRSGCTFRIPFADVADG